MNEKEFKIGDIVRCGSYQRDMVICSINPKNETAILGYFIEDQFYEEIKPLSTLKYFSDPFKLSTPAYLPDEEVSSEPHTNNKLHPVSMVPIENHVDFKDIKIWE